MRKTKFFTKFSNIAHHSFNIFFVPYSVRFKRNRQNFKLLPQSMMKCRVLFAFENSPIQKVSFAAPRKRWKLRPPIEISVAFLYSFCLFYVLASETFVKKCLHFLSSYIKFDLWVKFVLWGNPEFMFKTGSLSSVVLNIASQSGKL